MKTIACEMCGSTDLLKQEGVYVCRFCGTKYTVEEARKLMIDGTVDVQGTVKIDTSDELQKLYQAARNARETSDDESALKHYESISAKDPDSWEALFYLVILKTNSIKNGQIGSAAVSVSNSLPKVFELIDTTIADEHEKKKAVREVVEQCFATAKWLTNASHSFYKTMTKGNGMMALTGVTGALSSLNSLGNAIGKDQDRRVNIANIMCYCGNLIEQMFGLEDADYQAYALWSWKKMLDFNAQYKADHSSNLFDNESLGRFTSKVREYEESYETSEEKEAKRKQQDSLKIGKMFAISSLAMFFTGPTALVFGCIALSKPIHPKYKACAIAGTILSASITIALIVLILSSI